ncbi:MAG: hypothetical protein NC820_06970, partial [Candidatus Omnitrophica bacterium]|nr:hypothetical protein [Candidatus Omnitrophota bacterium]
MDDFKELVDNKLTSQQISDKFVPETEEKITYGDFKQDDREYSETFLRVLGIGKESKTFTKDSVVKSESSLQKIEFSQEGIRIIYRRDDYGKDSQGSYALRKTSFETRLNGDLVEIGFGKDLDNLTSKELIFYNGPYGRFGIPDRSVRIVKGENNQWYILTISNNTYLDPNTGNLTFIKKWILPIQVEGTSNINLDTIFANQAYRSQVIIRSGRGYDLTTLDGYLQLASQIDPAKDNYGRPLWITFIPEYDDFGFAKASYTYPFDPKKGINPNSYRTKGRFFGLGRLFGKTYTAAWDDSDWIAKYFNLEFESKDRKTFIAYSIQDYRKGRELQKKILLTIDGRVIRLINANAKVRVANGILGYAIKGFETVYYDEFERPLYAKDDEERTTQDWRDEKGTPRINYNTQSGEEKHTITKRNPLGPDITHDNKLTLKKGEFKDERRIGINEEYKKSLLANKNLVLIPILGFVSLIFIGWLLSAGRWLRIKMNLAKNKNSPTNSTTIAPPPNNDQIPQPTYNYYGFDDQIARSARHKFSVIISRLKRGDSLEDIIKEYFESYLVWRKEVLKLTDNFNPSLEDLWLFFLLQQGSIYFHNDTPSFFNYLLYKAIQFNHKNEGNKIGELVRKEVERWYTILNLTLSNFKGIGPFADTSQLVPYQYIFNIDDLEELFRTKEFIDFYDRFSEENRERLYGDLIRDLKDKVEKLIAKIKELNDKYGKDDKSHIKNKVLKTDEYKEYIEFLKKEWSEGREISDGTKKPLFYKTYSDTVGGIFGWKGWLHSFRNSYPFVFFIGQVTLLALVIALCLKGTLFSLSTISVIIGLETTLLWGKKGLDEIIKRIEKLPSHPIPIRPDKGYKKSKVSLGLKIFRWAFWITLAGLKLGWNIIVWKYLTIGLSELWGSSWTTPLLGINLNLILIAGLLLPFALFFFLDTFSIFYLMESVVGYIYGKYLGLGIVKEGRILGIMKIENARETFIKLIQERFIPEELSLNEEQKEVVVAEIINLILTILREEDMITDEELIDNKWEIKRDNPENFFGAKVTPPKSFFSVKNYKIRKRISVFLNSLFMDMPKMPLWEKIKSLTSMPPVGPAETIVYSYKELDKKLDTGLTVLTYLISRYPDLWKNFIERIKRENKANTQEIERMQNLKLGEQLGTVNEELEWEIRRWASLRFQPFLRTLNGLMHYVAVLKLYAKINHPDWSREKINEEINEKFQLLWGHQGYGDFVAKNDAKAQETIRLAQEYYKKYGFLIDIAYVQKRADGYFYSVLARINPQTNNIEDVFAVKLCKELPTISEGKPANQTHTRRFARGEAIMTIDINQDFYVEQAFKLPHLLSTFDEDKDIAIVGYPEDIFTDDYSWIGKFHAFADRTFNTLVQRTLTLLGARFHYGHPDLWRASYVDQFGGVSRSYPVNEDIFGGYEMTLRGKRIVYREYIEAGKAREVSWGTTFGIFI